MARLRVSRAHVLAFRRRVGGLDERVPRSDDALRRAAWAGLTDSVPRAALLSLHARVAGVTPDPWREPFVQLWGPRFSAYVVAAPDRALFSLGRLPADPTRRAYAEDLAERLAALLADGREMRAGEAGRALGEHHTMLRYAATTGRVLIRWDGAHQPTVRTAPRPGTDPEAARLELVRRYLHVLGPGTVTGFAGWAGLKLRSAAPAFAALEPELTPVGTDVGDAWVLAADEPLLRAAPGPTAPARLLPSGDTFTLLWGADRELVVPDPDRRGALWTSRVWPGAVLVDGDVAGTWRRADERVTVSVWRPLTTDRREAVEQEAASMPLPGLRGPVTVRWEE